MDLYRSMTLAVVMDTYSTRYKPVCSPATKCLHVVVFPEPLSPVTSPTPRMSTRCLSRALSSASDAEVNRSSAAKSFVEGVAREREVLSVHQKSPSSSRSTEGLRS
jgi:hypothetical protein